MLRTLSFRQKILALPALAAIGFVFVLGVSLATGVVSSRQLDEIRRRSASRDASTAMQSSADAYQRALRDAVGAQDALALMAVDSLADSFAAAAESARTSGADSASVAQLVAMFSTYREHAKETSAAMIEGSLGERAMTELPRMAAGYAALRDTLAARSAGDAAATDAAFDTMRKAQTTATIVLVAVIVLCLAAVGFTATAVIRDVLGALGSMSDAAAGIAHGRLDQSIDYRSGDEVGRLADAMRGTVAYIGGIAGAAGRLAAGDLSVEVAMRSPDDLLSKNMNDASATLQALVGQAGSLIGAARDGRMDARGDASRFSGAYAELVQGMNAMLDAVAEPMAQTRRVLERVADRDLAARMEGRYAGDHAAVQAALNRALDNLASTIDGMRQSISRVAAASGEIASGAQELASGASEQASALEHVTQRVQTVGERVRANEASANAAQGIVETARDATQSGVQSMDGLAAAVAEIKSSADRTAKIVKTIDEIAFQTNLLALNAAVEAARAGDAGRGFAVVAEEVRSLAGRAAAAARDTSALIEESVRSADKGVALNAGVRRQLDEISGSVTKAATAMRDIAAATAAQTRDLGDISAAVEQMSSVTQRTAANAEEAAGAATEMSAQAADMHRLAAQFRLAEDDEPAVASRARPLPPSVRRTPHKGTRSATTRATTSAARPDHVLPMEGGDDDLLRAF